MDNKTSPKNRTHNLSVRGPHLRLCKTWGHILDEIYIFKGIYQYNTVHRAKIFVEIGFVLPKNKEMTQRCRLQAQSLFFVLEKN